MDAKIGGRVVRNVIEAKIIRADGTIEDLGVVGYWHRNPFKRWMFRVRKFLSRR